MKRTPLCLCAAVLLGGSAAAHAGDDHADALQAVAAAAGAETRPTTRPAAGVRFTIIRQPDEPVIHKDSPGAEDNQYGFEGGSTLKQRGTYHLFTSEMAGDPWWTRMRLGHWTSRDAVRWTRHSTLYESSGDYTGKDPRAALWSPMPIFNEREDRWNLFYVAYRSAPDTPPESRRNYDGHIWRAVSETPGPDGIAGPYKDIGVVLKPGPDCKKWEGLQGTDSFFPYLVGRKWYALYGSAQTQYQPIPFWGVGLAEAPELAGPWKRCAGDEPVPIDPVFTENPIVCRLGNGTCIAVCDTFVPNAIAYSVSRDGVHWSPASHIVLKQTETLWVKDLRTPLGLIDEGNDTFSVLYTGYATPAWKSYGCVGLVTVRMEVLANTKP